MANVVVTLKIMPESPEVDIKPLETKALAEIKAFAGDKETKVEVHPVAFGLKLLQIFFVMDEAKGSTEPLEKKIAEIEGIGSVEVSDVRRAVG